MASSSAQRIIRVRGAWRIGSKDGFMGSKRYFGDDSQQKKLWEYTWESVSVD